MAYWNRSTRFAGHTSGTIVPAQGVGTRISVYVIYLQAEAPTTIEWLSAATTISGQIDLPVMATPKVDSSWTTDGVVWRPVVGVSSCFGQCSGRSGIFTCASNEALNLTSTEPITGVVYWKAV